MLHLIAHARIAISPRKSCLLNVALTGQAKEFARGLGTNGMEAVLANFAEFLKGDLKSDTLTMPTAAVKSMAMLASVTLSRILKERYKLERQTGQRYEVEVPTVQVVQGVDTESGDPVFEAKEVSDGGST